MIGDDSREDRQQRTGIRAGHDHIAGAVVERWLQCGRADRQRGGGHGDSDVPRRRLVLTAHAHRQAHSNGPGRQGWKVHRRRGRGYPLGPQFGDRRSVGSRHHSAHREDLARLHVAHRELSRARAQGVAHGRFRQGSFCHDCVGGLAALDLLAPGEELLGRDRSQWERRQIQCVAAGRAGRRRCGSPVEHDLDGGPGNHAGHVE